MSADPIVYCLEHLTDPSEFERLCSDVMSQSGHPAIEPLGGVHDRGRDALHVSRSDPEDVTILAYSIRADWQKKLREDCERIQEERHTCRRLVFVCTATITSTQRDRATESTRDRFGWDLELYGLERLRVLLAGNLRHLLAQHQSIFHPPFFPARGGLSISECRDTLVVDHVADDHALATWLARRLQLAGYKTWCYGTAPLAGEEADDSVRTLMESRALRYIPVLSSSSVGSPDLLGRCSIGAGRDQLTIPCEAGLYDRDLLPGRVGSISPVSFAGGWSNGLRSLLDALDAAGIHAATQGDRARQIALRSYVPEPVTRAAPESVYTNTFKTTVPEAVVACELRRKLSLEEEESFRGVWAFARASETLLLAFEPPPRLVPLRPSARLPEYAWRHYDERYGKKSRDVVKELVRRSMDVACYRAGMQRCADRDVLFFPQQEKARRNSPFFHVDGRHTRVALTGEKTQPRGRGPEPFRYQLCPRFRVGFDEDHVCWVTLRIYVRVTDRDGVPHQRKAITRRRKTVTRSWWNKEWFARTLGMMQALSEGCSEIVVGSGRRSVTVSCQPMQWSCPVSIDYGAVERLGDYSEEMAALRHRGDDHDDEVEETPETLTTSEDESDDD